MSEYIVWESDKSQETDNLGVKHSVSHFEKREEIVRCRDCKHYNAKLTDEDDGTSWCCIHAGYAFEDDFCAWGERNA